MAAREKQNVSGHLAHSLHYAICSRSNLFWHFAARAAVAEQLPVRTFSKDVNRAATFVLAIVPFDQVRVNFSNRSESSQLARSHSTAQRAGEYLRKCHIPQSLPQFSRVAFSLSVS